MADNTEHTLPTRDRVFAICDDLFRRNQKLSVRLVHSMLPDIVSISTIHKPYKEWMDQLEARQHSMLDKLGFSDAFVQSFMREVTRFGVEAEERYKTMAIDAKEQRDTAIEDLERTEEKYFKQNALVEQQAKEIRELKAGMVERQRAQEATVAEVRQQLQEAQSINSELSTTNEGLRTELARMQVQLDNNNALVSEVKQNAQAIQGENLDLREKHAQLITDVARLETTLETRQQLVDELRSTANRLQGEMATAEERHKADLGERRQEVFTLKEEQARLRQQLEDSRQQLTDTRQQLADTTGKSGEQVQVIADLRATVAEQSRVIERLAPADKPRS